MADKRTQPSPGRERTFLFLPFVHGRTDNEQMAGYVYARDFQPNWQANTSQRMQISQTICQSSRWPCPLLHGREGHFNRQSFTIRLRSIGSLHSFSRISLSPPPLSLSLHLSISLFLSLSLRHFSLLWEVRCDSCNSVPISMCSSIYPTSCPLFLLSL